MLKNKKLVITLGVIILVLSILFSIGNLTLNSRGKAVLDLLEISYAPKDIETFEAAGLDMLKYVNESDTSALFTRQGDELTEYDLVKRVNITMDIKYGLYPRLVYRVIVNTPSGLIDLIINMDYGLLGFGKVKDVNIYNISK